MRFTILGHNGFIGRHLTAHLCGLGHEVRGLGRGFELQPDEPLGHVIFAVGLTGDFRGKPLETMEAHVGLLADVLAGDTFESLTYLSSTRVYQHSPEAREESALTVHPADPSDLYNVSKLAGESLCLTLRNPAIRVVRLSNVIDPAFQTPTFLSMVVREAWGKGAVTMGTSPGSSKDYVPLPRVLDWMTRVAVGGRHRIYNLASGCNVDNRTVATLLGAELGCRVGFAPDASDVTFPPIDVHRVHQEFGSARVDPEWELRQALKAAKPPPDK